MKVTKRIKVPYIAGLEKMDLSSLDLAMEKAGTKVPVSENNWQKDFPYSPDCNAVIARSDIHMVVLFHVRGLDLRGTTMEDNGPTFQDSCCEFFLTDPYDGTYYNFEVNCIGTVNAAKRTSRINRDKLDAESLSRIIRLHSVEREVVEKSDSIESWTVAILIPYDIIGINPNYPPVSLRGNFYKCGNKTAHPHYLSWNPIQTSKPDFHRPEYFGELIFQ